MSGEPLFDVQQRLFDLSRLVSDWLWECDRDHHLTYVSDRVLQILGRHPSEVMGKRLEDVGTWAPEGGSASTLDLSQPFRGARFLMQKRGGELRTFLLSGVPVFSEETGDLLGARGTAQDITETEDAERQVRMLSSAIEQSPNMVIITDRDGHIEYVNPRFQELTGYAVHEVLGRNPRILQSGDTPDSVYEDLWNTVSEGRDWRGDLKDQRKDGSIFWSAVSITPVIGRDGVISHYVAVHDDITERKLAEERALSAREEADIANRAKSEMLANMSHELRTPLNAIIGFSNMLLSETFGELANEKQHEYVEDIRGSGEHLLDLINDLLDMSVIEAGQLELHPENLDVDEVLEACLRLVRTRAQQGRVRLEEGERDPGLNLVADRKRLKQVLLNLLTNAIKFTLPDGTVRLDVSRNEGMLAFTVTDTGIGMDEKGVAKAMTQFGQIDSSQSRKHQGTGLGLPLAYNLVEAHGGNLVIESQPGVGTTVRVTFPEKPPSGL